MTSVAIVLLACVLPASEMAQTSIDLNLERAYLNLPGSYNDNDAVLLDLVVGGKVVRDFEIHLPDSNPDS